MLDPQKWAVFVQPWAILFLWTGIRITVTMAAIAIVASLTLGLVLALLRISRFAVLRYPAALFVELIRALPVLVLILFCFLTIKPALNLDAFGAAALALSLYTGAVNAEIMRAGILSVERGQVEAARSLGLSYVQTMRYVVLPQALRRVIPPQVSQLITLIKDTSLAGVVGVAELTQRTRNLYQLPGEGISPIHALFVAALIYFTVNFALSRFTRRWELAVGGAPAGVDAH